MSNFVLFFNQKGGNIVKGIPSMTEVTAHKKPLNARRTKVQGLERKSVSNWKTNKPKNKQGGKQ